ncbi:uncharacterized protein LOC124926800 [Impatiens glandulifera]|uniref:uncharacterized protein LOC124926800 n=1 Tax=Impatiens glandulifera TaxID=253017 RepID=UPI001FB0A52F|nr:uncharacterized protein LOC124926800 [Impatiens glandulifera]
MATSSSCSLSRFLVGAAFFKNPSSSSSQFLPPSRVGVISSLHPSSICKFPSCFRFGSWKRRSAIFSKSSEEEAAVTAAEDNEWFPDKKKPLYSHSLPCVEAWLKKLGFSESEEDRATWVIQRPDWHAQLSLDVTDLYIRYMKNGPGNLEKDVERRFSYALSREDIENAILGGP